LPTASQRYCSAFQDDARYSYLIGHRSQPTPDGQSKQPACEALSGSIKDGTNQMAYNELKDGEREDGLEVGLAGSMDRTAQGNFPFGLKL